VIDWSPVWLGVIAVSLVVMTSLQLWAAIAAITLARQTGQALRDFQREVQPLVEKAHRIADDAARTTALAAAQAERLDAFVRATTDRVDETFGCWRSPGRRSRSSTVHRSAAAAPATTRTRSSSGDRISR
jgi:hypothetical protein